MKEVRETSKSFETQVLDRLAALEHQMGIVMNEVYWHSSFDVESNRKKIFLKGRVDDLELRIRDLIETFNTKEDERHAP